MLECVINVSEGRDPAVLDQIVAAGGPYVLDVHSDPDHHRAVLTLGGAPPAGDGLEEAVRSVATATVKLVDLGAHTGAHPRIGALDVVPFVALRHDEERRLVDGPVTESQAARDRFARWAGTALSLPCFLYGPERSLPDLRREAWNSLPPDTGPRAPHPSAGAAAVGARPVLVAYNLWLAPGADVPVARAVAGRIRKAGLRSLGLQVGDLAQVSCNLVDPWRLGPGAVFDRVAEALEEEMRTGGAATGIERAELVGLVPAGVLHREPFHRWHELGLDPGDTIEARLEQAGLDGGRF